MSAIPSKVAALHRFCRQPTAGREELDRFRDQQLRRMVQHAYEQAPFYRRRFREAGVHPTDVKGVADLHRLPAISKKPLLDSSPEDLLAAGSRRGRLVQRRTEGSTGEPLTVFRSNFEERLLQAFRLRVMASYGVRLRDVRVKIGWHRRQGCL